MMNIKNQNFVFTLKDTLLLYPSKYPPPSKTLISLSCQISEALLEDSVNVL